MAQKLELEVAFKTNEYYDVDNVTVLFPDDVVESVKKAQKFLQENRDIDSIRVRVPEDCVATGTDYRLGFACVIVGCGDALYFFAQDNFNSQNQIESDSFYLD